MLSQEGGFFRDAGSIIVATNCNSEKATRINIEFRGYKGPSNKGKSILVSSENKFLGGKDMNSFSSGRVGPNGVVPDSFQAFLIDGAELTSKEQYPILRADMIPKSPPLKILPFNKAINYHRDLRDTYICTYSPDSSFERVRRCPQRYVEFFRRTAGIIGFDYSIHVDMPLIKQKQQINDNLSLSYYFGNQGINIVPNIRCGIDSLLPEYLEAIPKHCMIAIGTHGFIKEISEKCEWRCFLDNVLPILEPSTIVCYGSLSGRMFDETKQRYNFVFYEPWIGERRKEVMKHVDQRCE